MSISHIPDLYLLLNGMCFGRYPAPNLVDPLKNGSRIRTPTRSTLYFASQVPHVWESTDCSTSCHCSLVVGGVTLSPSAWGFEK